MSKRFPWQCPLVQHSVTLPTLRYDDSDAASALYSMLLPQLEQQQGGTATRIADLSFAATVQEYNGGTIEDSIGKDAEGCCDRCANNIGGICLWAAYVNARDPAQRRCKRFQIAMQLPIDDSGPLGEWLETGGYSHTATQTSRVARVETGSNATVCQDIDTSSRYWVEGNAPENQSFKVFAWRKTFDFEACYGLAATPALPPLPKWTPAPPAPPSRPPAPANPPPLVRWTVGTVRSDPQQWALLCD